MDLQLRNYLASSRKKLPTPSLSSEASRRLSECELPAVQRLSHSDLLPLRGQLSGGGRGRSRAPRPRRRAPPLAARPAYDHARLRPPGVGPALRYLCVARGRRPRHRAGGWDRGGERARRQGRESAMAAASSPRAAAR